jgi:hypothetical protein
MMAKQFRRVCVGALVAAVASCALPELTIDPNLGGGGSSNAGSGGGSEKGGDGSAGKPTSGSGNQSTDGGASDSGASGGSEGGASAGTDSGGTDSAGTDSAGTGGSSGAPPGGSGNGGDGGACSAMCSGSCADLTSDEKNCGQCGTTCDPDETCVDSDCTGPCGAAFDATTGGFVTSPGKDGCWHGLAFVSRGGITANVTPASFASCGADCQLCVSGTMKADPTYATYMGMGVALNQASSGGATATTTPKGTGLAISVTNTAGSPLRVQLTGQGQAGLSWCHTLTGAGSQIIPYSAFNTQCWSNEGVFYNGEPIEAVVVHGSGASNVDVPVDFCINELKDQ